MSGEVTVGWRETVALPELGIERIRAKIDTGARSSSLHVDRQWRLERDGEAWVGFEIRPRPGADVVTVEARLIDEREVVDSGGHRVRRPFIRARMRLADIDREIELNLADRAGMRFPMLLGRQAMRDGFVVDPSRSHLHRRRKGAE
ncbi:ATP-dependent zinc protease family protein [Solilutibacter silvestris]|uniref:ATP-dependent zinc protease family protein n=1 Tax=Solilutibacter silvestris TaxID=1645665 RepID=UPI003D341AD1